MLNVNPWNLICIVLNLLILAALMKKFLYKPVLGIIEKRQNMIDEQMAQAQSCKEEAEQMKEKYEASLSEMQNEKEQMIKDAKVQAGLEYKKIVEDAGKEAVQMLEDAKKLSQAEKERTVKEAEGEIARLAAEAAAKIVGEVSGQENDARIYEDFLRKAGE